MMTHNISMIMIIFSHHNEITLYLIFKFMEKKRKIRNSSKVVDDDRPEHEMIK